MTVRQYGYGPGIDVIQTTEMNDGRVEERWAFKGSVYHSLVGEVGVWAESEVGEGRVEGLAAESGRGRWLGEFEWIKEANFQFKGSVGEAAVLIYAQLDVGGVVQGNDLRLWGVLTGRQGVARRLDVQGGRCRRRNPPSPSVSKWNRGQALPVSAHAGRADEIIG